MFAPCWHGTTKRSLPSCGSLADPIVPIGGSLDAWLVFSSVVEDKHVWRHTREAVDGIYFFFFFVCSFFFKKKWKNNRFFKLPSYCWWLWDQRWWLAGLLLLKVFSFVFLFRFVKRFFSLRTVWSNGTYFDCFGISFHARCLCVDSPHIGFANRLHLRPFKSEKSPSRPFALDGLCRISDSGISLACACGERFSFLKPAFLRSKLGGLLLVTFFPTFARF